MTTHKPSQLLYHNRTYLLAISGLVLIVCSLLSEHYLWELVTKLTGEVGGLLLIIGVLHGMFEHGMRQEMLKEISEAVLGNEHLRQAGFIDYQQDSSQIDKRPEEKRHWQSTERFILCICPHEGRSYEEVIQQRCKNKKKSELFLAATDSFGEHDPQTTHLELAAFEKALKNIDGHQDFITIVKHQKSLKYSVILTEEYAWIKSFPNSHRRLDFPALKVRAGTPFYQFLQKDLEAFRKDTSPTDSKPRHRENFPVSASEKTVPPPLSKQIVISSKRGIDLDDQVSHLIENNLTKIGCSVIIERHVRMTEEWKQERLQAIQQADVVIVLLSAISIYSEMLAEDMDVAYQTAQRQGGKPRLLPVRVNFTDPFPQNLANLLGSQPSITWQSSTDDDKLLNHLATSLALPLTGSSKRYELEVVGGAIPLDSKFYIERPVDNELSTAMTRRDRIILLKGARQVGKTSLLSRGLQQAREAGIQVLLTDFQRLGDEELKSIDTFFITLAEMLARQLNLDFSPHEQWKDYLPAKSNFESFFEKLITKQSDQPILLWAIDEADRLFPYPFRDDVFSLFRVWFNEGSKSSSPYSRLMLVIVYATETHYFIQNPTYSPFNVGTKLTLEDFTLTSIQDLHQRYGHPLNDSELDQFFTLIGGHPYLARRGFNEMVERRLSFTQFMSHVESDEGPFGDHLRRMVMLLDQKPDLETVIRNILAGQPCPDYDSFYRLRGLGILKGEKEEAQLRCELYERYLKKRLK